jgi:4-hydroxy-tetrahydrodipicolinate synthase
MTTPEWPVGLLTALVTPLREDAVNVAVLHELVEQQYRSGAGGIVIGGGTGEFGALDLAERRQLTAQAVAAAQGRIPIIAQTGALATRDAVSLSQTAQAAGATALMVASPFGEPITWDERFAFYATVSAEVDLPIMIYNTQPAGLLSFSQVERLTALPRVSAIKDSSGDPEFLGDLLAWADSDVAVYVGFDSLLYDAIAGGARGAVLGTGNLLPGVLSDLARSLRERGATAESRAFWNSHLRPLLRSLEQSPNYVALCKAAVAARGLAVGPVRPPFLMPEQAAVDELSRLVIETVQAFERSALHNARSHEAGA